MVGRSVPVVLAVSVRRPREVANADAGAKRKRVERSAAAEESASSKSVTEAAACPKSSAEASASSKSGAESPRSVAQAGTKSRREAEEGSSGDGPVGRRARMRLQPPSAHAVQRLVNACRVVLRGSATAPPPAVVSLIGRILNGIGPEDVGLRQEVRFFNKMNCAGRQNPPIITCKTLFECDHFTIAVFFLPAGTVMPLHDHPGMTVFSKLLIGSAHVKSYDWIYPYIFVGLDPDDRSVLAKKVLDHELTAAASGPWVLYPSAGGNMHRFVAGEEGPCAFLDVLTPPYSPSAPPPQRRQCTFYQDIPYELHPNVFGGNVSEEQKRRLAWLRRIGTPRDLRIANLPYRGPPIL